MKRVRYFWVEDDWEKQNWNSESGIIDQLKWNYDKNVPFRCKRVKVTIEEILNDRKTIIYKGNRKN